MGQLRLAILGLVSSTMAVEGCFMTRPVRTTLGDAPKDLSARTVEIASASGSKLRAWFFPGMVGKGAVLLLHGVGANRGIMLGRARFLQQSGYSVLAPDFQAHGESPGDHITFGAKESADAEAALQFLREQALGEAVGIVGVSMGGAAALLGGGARCADALVLESVYPTIHDAVVDRLQTWLGPFGFAARAVAPLVIRSVGSEIGVTENQLRPIDHIDSVSAPVLIASGTEDPYTRITEARALFERATAPKEFWAVQGAGHVDLFAYDSVAYEQRVGGFLDLHLRQMRLKAASNGCGASNHDTTHGDRSIPHADVGRQQGSELPRLAK